MFLKSCKNRGFLVPISKFNMDEITKMFFFKKKWANPGLFFFYFRSFQTSITTIFTTNICGKNVHPVYSTGIRTLDLWNMSLFPLPQDQGSRPNNKNVCHP